MAEENNLRLRLPPLEIGENDGFAKHDLFTYAEFGARLGGIFTKLDDISVVALDSDWGSGKSVFAQQWAGHMRGQGQRVSYIDAFKNDYLADPFILLTREILGKESEENSKLRDTAYKFAAVLLRNTIQKASGGLVKASDIKELIGAPSENGEIAEQKAFREALQTYCEKQPRIVIIDELDRCRPDFALRLLERVKHFFDIPKLKFLIVTNSDKLQAMVTREYGFKNDDAEDYLGKFFQLTLPLPQEKAGVTATRQAAFVQYLWRELGFDAANYPAAPFFVSEAARLALSLRQIEAVASHVALCIVRDQSGDRPLNQTYHFTFIYILCVLKIWRPAIIDELERNPSNAWAILTEHLRLATVMASDADMKRYYESTKDIMKERGGAGYVTESIKWFKTATSGLN